MVLIHWMNQAVNDLHLIKSYIAVNSPYYAKITVDKLKNSTKTLKEFPQIGRIVPEFEDETVREIITGNYRIIYHNYTTTEIWILSIIHSSRDLSKIYLERPL